MSLSWQSVKWGLGRVTRLAKQDIYQNMLAQMHNITVCVCMGKWLCMCVCVFESKRLRVCVSKFVCVCLCSYVRECVFVCMRRCEFLCICVCVRKRLWFVSVKESAIVLESGYCCKNQLVKTRLLIQNVSGSLPDFFLFLSAVVYITFIGVPGCCCALPLHVRNSVQIYIWLQQWKHLPRPCGQKPCPVPVMQSVLTPLTPPALSPWERGRRARNVRLW